MKNTTQRFLKLIGIVVPTLMLVVYLVWVAMPFSPTVEIVNLAGISDQDVAEVLAYARSCGEFDEEQIRRIEGTSGWTPWSRGHLFLHIEGNLNKVDVSAGHYENGLSGGGTKFTGSRTPEGWTFSRTGAWML